MAGDSDSSTGDGSNLTPQQTALLLSLMSSQQGSNGSMVPGGGGKQGTFAANAPGTDAENTLSKVMQGLAVKRMLQNQNLNKAQGQAQSMIPQTNQQIANDPQMQALQNNPVSSVMPPAPTPSPVASISPGSFGSNNAMTDDTALEDV